MHTSSDANADKDAHADKDACAEKNGTCACACHFEGNYILLRMWYYYTMIVKASCVNIWYKSGKTPALYLKLLYKLVSDIQGVNPDTRQ